MHAYIVGTTECGKSWAAKYMARYLHKNRCTIAVYDPKFSGSMRITEEWKADFITNNKTDFLKWFWTNTDAFCFIDEAHKFDDTRDEAVTTLGRGLGHSVFLISQSTVQMSRTLRKQCAGGIAFNQGKTDSKYLADDLGDYFKDCPGFGRGEFALSCPAYKMQAAGSTLDESGLKDIEKFCDLMIDVKPEPDLEMVDLHGCYMKPNWKHLEREKLIYED